MKDGKISEEVKRLSPISDVTVILSRGKNGTGIAKHSITNEAIAEYKQILKEEKGIDLSDKEAAEQAMGLLNLFDKLFVEEGEA